MFQRPSVPVLLQHLSQEPLPTQICCDEGGRMGAAALLGEINLQPQDQVTTCSWMITSKFLREVTGLLQKNSRSKVSKLETKQQYLTTVCHPPFPQPPHSDRSR